MVLSIAHMSMVIFPFVFYIFHMSGVKKKRKKQQTKHRAAPSPCTSDSTHDVSIETLPEHHREWILNTF